MSEEVFVGIDVSKDRVDVCILPQQEKMSLARDDKELRALACRLAGLGVTLAVLEATGGLERIVVRHLIAEAIPVTVANPRRARQYAQAAGVMAKTDSIDAYMLACFGRDIRPKKRPGRSPQEEVIRELVARRSQLMGMRVAELNRMERACEKAVVASIRSALLFLDKEIAAVDERIDDEIEKDPTWKDTDELLRSVPGVGEKTSRMLIAALPEIGRLSPKEAASLAGLAPFANDSGKMKGRRMVRGGRSSVRQALYMSALVASRHNQDIRMFYQRLRKNGKSGKVALTACMRKLLITLNAVVKRGTKWTPQNA